MGLPFVKPAILSVERPGVNDKPEFNAKFWD